MHPHSPADTCLTTCIYFTPAKVSAMNTPTPKLISYASAAVGWNVSERTISRLVASGKVKAYTHSDDRRRRLVAVDEVAAALGPAPAEHAETTKAVAEVATALLVASALDEGAYKQVRDTLDADLLNDLSRLLGGVDRLLALDERAGYPTEKR